MGLLLVLLSLGEAASWTMSLRSLTELRGTVEGSSKLTTFYLNLSSLRRKATIQAAVLSFMGLLALCGNELC